MAAKLRVCVDVDDLERAIAFYSQALGLSVVRRSKDSFCELGGAPIPIDLLGKKSGTNPLKRGEGARDYARHWTPVHLDFVVPDLEAAVARAVGAGAVQESEIEWDKWGGMAVFSDPFGHGFCLLEFRGRGYDEVIPAAT